MVRGLASYTFILIAVICSCPVASANASEEGGYGTVIGVDLGATYSRVGVRYEEREVIIISALSWNDIALGPLRAADKDGTPVVTVNHKNDEHNFSPQEISAMIISQLKEAAEVYLGEKVTHAVFTVPAYFNDAQRQATRNAGTLAGLTVLRIINEPTSALISHGFHKIGGELQFLVFDLGGTTLDITVDSIEDGVFEILATSAETRLGGDDFDSRVVKHFVNEYKRTGTDVTNNPRAMGLLKWEAEKAKRILSAQESVLVEIESFEDGKDFSQTLTRTKFEELNMDLFKATMGHVNQALQDANISKWDIDKIVLVGGSSRIPRIRQLLTDLFYGREPSQDINPDEVVVRGAAIQADIVANANSVGCIFHYPEPIRLTLGIEIDGNFTPIMPRDAALSSKTSKIFSTATDNQTSFPVRVFEGEFSHSSLLGEFNFTGITPAPRGIPQIQITFEISRDDVLTVTATEVTSGKSEFITIDNEKRTRNWAEIGRILKVGEEIAEREAAHHRAAIVHHLSSVVDKLSAELDRQERLGDQISSEKKRYYLGFIDESTEWIRWNTKFVQTPTGFFFNSRTTEALLERAAVMQGFVNRALSTFSEASSGSVSDQIRSHDEL